LQHLSDDDYREFKQQMAREAARKAGFDPGCVEPLVRIPPASRRRVELKVAGGRLGYYEERSHRLVPIEECKVLEPALESLVLRLGPWIATLPEVRSVQINGVDTGYDILLGGKVGGAPSIPSFVEAEKVARISIQEDAGIRTLFQVGPVTVTMGEVKVDISPGAFLQASREAQGIMTDYVLAHAAGSGRVLDLFSGLGTYSFSLAMQAEVTAVEGDALMVKALQEAAKKSQSGVKAIRRDLFRDPLKVEELNRFDAVVINPPRAGASEQSAMLARSKVKKLVMISCNPATFARDARLLKEGGYALENIRPIDQFTYSSHLEINASFAK
jgi:23S rRNA (uracil1939-C5)-methyltransferase